jgi:hypothetical protein
MAKTKGIYFFSSAKPLLPSSKYFNKQQQMFFFQQQILFPNSKCFPQQQVCSNTKLVTEL